MADVAEKTWDWAEFLTSAPPESDARVTGAVTDWGAGHWRWATPDLVLFCGSELCGGERVYSEQTGNLAIQLNKWDRAFLEYRCKNCDKSFKLYAVLLLFDTMLTRSGRAYKMGEWPPFGPEVPARLISLIGPDRELFLKGRRAENRNLGMGAFAYYRRVVENQKNRLLDEIIKVSQRVGVKPAVITTLEHAKIEHQFTKAVEEIKDAIPDAIRIDSHNPLTLLHDALSRGLHAKTDEECLGYAQAIRVVLTSFAERVQHVLQEDAELKQAIARLNAEINPQAAKKDADKG